MIPDPLEEKTVVVLGFARQGQALARWLPTIGANVVVSDTRSFGDLADAMLDFLDSPITYAVGGHPLELLDDLSTEEVRAAVDATQRLSGERREPVQSRVGQDSDLDRRRMSRLAS